MAEGNLLELQGCGWVCVLVVVRLVFAWNLNAFRKKKNSQSQTKMKNKQKAPQNQNPKRLYIKKIAPVLGVPWNISRDILKKN